VFYSTILHIDIQHIKLIIKKERYKPICHLKGEEHLEKTVNPTQGASTYPPTSSRIASFQSMSVKSQSRSARDVGPVPTPSCYAYAHQRTNKLDQETNFRTPNNTTTKTF